MHVDPDPDEFLAEAVQLRRRRWTIGSVWPWIERDQVDFGRQGGEPFGQSDDTGVAVVDPRDQHIGHHEGIIFFERVGYQGLLEALERGLTVQRHQPGPEPVFGGVERHRQFEVRHFQPGQLFNPVDTPGRGHRDVAQGNVQTPLIVHHAHGLNHIRKIVEGLAHAHEDHVAHRPAVASTSVVDLPHDFLCRELPHKPQAGRGAEAASHPAADLTGNADRLVGLHRQNHRFDAMTVFEHGDKFDHALLLGFLRHLSGLKDQVGRQPIHQAGCIVEGRRLPGLWIEAAETFAVKGRSHERAFAVARRKMGGKLLKCQCQQSHRLRRLPSPIGPR